MKLEPTNIALALIEEGNSCILTFNYPELSELEKFAKDLAGIFGGIALASSPSFILSQLGSFKDIFCDGDVEDGDCLNKCLESLEPRVVDDKFILSADIEGCVCGIFEAKAWNKTYISGSALGNEWSVSIDGNPCFSLS
jgi:hypothetical protein